MEAIGDRMKEYEAFSPPRMMKYIPTIIRLDGKGFHRFTEGLDKPFDQRLIDCFHSVTQSLILETNARIGYHQSDEISLILYNEEVPGEIYFSGKRDKINSILAAKVSCWFQTQVESRLGEDYYVRFPVLDCRTFQVPNLSEAVNYLVWRELDATRNSIQSAARSVYSHRECDNKTCFMLQDMLMEKGVNWNDYPDYFKRGQYFFRTKPKTLPKITSITNKVGVFFNNEEPNEIVS